MKPYKSKAMNSKARSSLNALLMFQKARNQGTSRLTSILAALRLSEEEQMEGTLEDEEEACEDLTVLSEYVRKNRQSDYDSDDDKAGGNHATPMTMQ